MAVRKTKPRFHHRPRRRPSRYDRQRQQRRAAYFAAKRLIALRLQRQAKRQCAILRTRQFFPSMRRLRPLLVKARPRWQRISDYNFLQFLLRRRHRRRFRVHLRRKLRFLLKSRRREKKPKRRGSPGRSLWSNLHRIRYLLPIYLQPRAASLRLTGTLQRFRRVRRGRIQRFRSRRYVFQRNFGKPIRRKLFTP